MRAWPITFGISVFIGLARCSAHDSGLSHDPDSAGPKPNIVAIFADDIGYGDLSCYGIDSSGLWLGKSTPAEPRMIFHYFGVQLQAVREGPWKLFVRVDEPPRKRVPSLWFEHRPELFERQHRILAPTDTP